MRFGETNSGLFSDPCVNGSGFPFVFSSRLRYNARMTEASELEVMTMPSALPPSEAELAAWHALSREEQLARYRQALQHPSRRRISDATMVDLLTKARRRVAARRNG